MALGSLFFQRKEPFWIGFVLRLALIAVAVPLIAANWFAPFIESFVHAPTLDPWTTHLAAGGDPAAFPYGPVMFLVLLPGIALGVAAKALFGVGSAPVIGYGIGLLIADIACLAAVSRLHKGDAALTCLWLSPAVIVITYWHGQNDLIPVAFLLASLLALRGYHAAWSGVVLGLAIAAKLSMLLAAPILAVYLYRNARLRGLLVPFLIGLAGPLLLQVLVFAISPGSRTMVLGTPEARKVFQLALDLGGGLKIYILPVVYLMTVFWIWRLRRMAFDLLIAVLGIVFLLVILLTPASPGWFIWAAPFLAIHAAQTGPRGMILVYGLAAVQAVSTLIQFSGASIAMLGLDWTAPLATTFEMADRHGISIMVSIMCAIGGFLAFRIWREGVRRNEFYRMSKQPLLIGIAGDSGAGKDTLAIGLAGIFGEQAVASISGDDYHKWERDRPMWSAMTHLDPRANDLGRMTQDVIKLVRGDTVSAHHYDHKTGRFTKPHRIQFNEVIIVSGLHALLLPALRERYDVRIYLDMDEELRRYFKVQRDVGERGHSPESVERSIERRRPDAVRFIDPQGAQADIVFSLQPVNRDHLKDPKRKLEVRVKLAVVLRHDASYEALVRVLIGICGLHVDVSLMEGHESVELVIEGDLDPEDIGLAASLLVPNLEELVALQPEWRGGMLGLMQLIVLTRAADAIRTAEMAA